ncbi:hypothetical protein KCU76_g67, partial [Aureobasidium melanogenum]
MSDSTLNCEPRLKTLKKSTPSNRACSDVRGTSSFASRISRSRGFELLYHLVKSAKEYTPDVDHVSTSNADCRCMLKSPFVCIFAEATMRLRFDTGKLFTQIELPVRISGSYSRTMSTNRFKTSSSLSSSSTSTPIDFRIRSAKSSSVDNTMTPTYLSSCPAFPTRSVSSAFNDHMIHEISSCSGSGARSLRELTWTSRLMIDMY